MSELVVGLACSSRIVAALAWGWCAAPGAAMAVQSTSPGAPPAPTTAEAPPLLDLKFADDLRLTVPGWEGARFWMEGRWRSEHWSHFETPATDGDYDFGHFRFRQGLAQKFGPVEFGFEWQSANVFGVDVDAPVGPGKNYIDANRSGSPQDLTVRQLWVDLAFDGSQARLGRQVYEDNAGVKYDDGAFQWLRDRGNARLVGNLDWTAGGRNWDGVSWQRESKEWLARAIAFEANVGAFDIDDGSDSLEDVQVGGLEIVSKRGTCVDSTELRAFGYAFRDDRPAAQAKFGDGLFATTAGAQATSRFATGPGALDLFLWGALQRGDAGARAQRAGAWVAEAGYRLDSVAWKPWFRVGHARAQGDSDATDGEVNDFYNGLPTNHTYYGFADLFALTNLRNSYFDLILDPHPQLRFMASAHLFAAASGGSRATFGSGAFTESTYGFGTFATTSRNFGKELDLTLRATTADKRFHALLGWSLFRGGTAFERLFTTADAQFAYLELGFKF